MDFVNLYLIIEVLTNTIQLQSAIRYITHSRNKVLVVDEYGVELYETGIPYRSFVYFLFIFLIISNLVWSGAALSYVPITCTGGSGNISVGVVGGDYPQMYPTHIIYSLLRDSFISFSVYLQPDGTRYMINAPGTLNYTISIVPLPTQEVILYPPPLHCCVTF
jgi:hypothetical protein